jgi:hypothetical protein
MHNSEADVRLLIEECNRCRIKKDALSRWSRGVSYIQHNHPLTSEQLQKIINKYPAAAYYHKGL